MMHDAGSWARVGAIAQPEGAAGRRRTERVFAAGPDNQPVAVIIISCGCVALSPVSHLHYQPSHQDTVVMEQRSDGLLEGIVVGSKSCMMMFACGRDKKWILAQTIPYRCFHASMTRMTRNQARHVRHHAYLGL